MTPPAPVSQSVRALADASAELHAAITELATANASAHASIANRLTRLETNSNHILRLYWIITTAAVGTTILALSTLACAHP